MAEPVRSGTRRVGPAGAAIAVAWVFGSILVPPFRWLVETAPGGPGPYGDPQFNLYFWPLAALFAAIWSAVPLALLGVPLVSWVLPRLTRQRLAGLILGAVAGAGLVELATASGYEWRAGGWPVGALYGGLAGLLGTRRAG